MHPNDLTNFRLALATGTPLGYSPFLEGCKTFFAAKDFKELLWQLPTVTNEHDEFIKAVAASLEGSSGARVIYLDEGTADIGNVHNTIVNSLYNDKYDDEPEDGDYGLLYYSRELGKTLALIQRNRMIWGNDSSGSKHTHIQGVIDNIVRLIVASSNERLFELDYDDGDSLLTVYHLDTPLFEIKQNNTVELPLIHVFNKGVLVKLIGVANLKYMEEISKYL